MSDGAVHAAGKAFSGLFGLIFPDECRVCGEHLREVSRIPVCSRCLREPEPFLAEFFCSSCRAPFLNRHPLDESGRCAMCRLGAAGFDSVYTYGSYEGSLRKLIHLFKYAGVETPGKALWRVFGASLATRSAFRHRGADAAALDTAMAARIQPGGAAGSADRR